MTLRQRILLFFGLTLVLLIAGVYGVTSRILLSGMDEVEQQDAQKDFQRADNALREEMSRFAAKAADWSVWDDAYAFVENGNRNFIKSNCGDATFVDLRLNTVVFVNRSGRVVFSKGFDVEREREAPVSAVLMGMLKPGNRLLQHASEDSVQAGFVLLPEGPMLVVSRPIITSERKGPIRGTLIFGRYLDAQFISRLGQATCLNLAVRRWDAPPFSQGTGLQVLDEKTVVGESRWADLFGKPAFVMRVAMPRDIHAEGVETVRYLLASLLVVGVGLGALSLVLLEWLVLRRMDRVAARCGRLARVAISRAG
jgi:sensor domain CHASE-containing protein